jgi:hypothetical protein
MTEITNTAKMDTADMLGFLVGGMGGDPSAPILAQEAQGQREVVKATTIPTDMHNKPEEFEALGFVLGAVKADDPMWREATLPDGWSREGSDHAMWSYIIDERGFRRCSIFYKAAFYDRSAHIGIAREPTTRAQDESYDAFDAWCPYRDGWKTDTYKEGDNLVRRARLCEVDERGATVFDHDAGDWKFAGPVRERVIAPDGSTIEDHAETGELGWS